MPRNGLLENIWRKKQANLNSFTGSLLTEGIQNILKANGEELIYILVYLHVGVASREGVGPHDITRLGSGVLTFNFTKADF